MIPGHKKKKKSNDPESYIKTLYIIIYPYLFINNLTVMFIKKET